MFFWESYEFFLEYLVCRAAVNDCSCINFEKSQLINYVHLPSRKAAKSGRSAIKLTGLDLFSRSYKGSYFSEGSFSSSARILYSLLPAWCCFESCSHIFVTRILCFRQMRHIYCLKLDSHHSERLALSSWMKAIKVNEKSFLYQIKKVFSFLRYLNFSPDVFDHVGKHLDKKANVNLKKFLWRCRLGKKYL